MYLTLAIIVTLLLTFENGRKISHNRRRIHHMGNVIDDVIAQFNTATNAIGARLTKLAADLAASQAATAAALAADASDQAKLAAAEAAALAPAQLAEMQALAAQLTALGADGSAPVAPAATPDPVVAPADGSADGTATV